MSGDMHVEAGGQQIYQANLGAMDTTQAQPTTANSSYTIRPYQSPSNMGPIDRGREGVANAMRGISDGLISASKVVTSLGEGAAIVPGVILGGCFVLAAALTDKEKTDGSLNPEGVKKANRLNNTGLVVGAAIGGVGAAVTFLPGLVIRGVFGGIGYGLSSLANKVGVNKSHEPAKPYMEFALKGLSVDFYELVDEMRTHAKSSGDQKKLTG